MTHKFQYWNGAAWVTETQLLKFTYVDTLGYPAVLEVTLGNRESTKEATYDDYMKVRLVDLDSSSRVRYCMFYGKLEKREPQWDIALGQVLVLSARDNLQELSKRIVNSDYSVDTLRSDVIQRAVTDYSRSGNIAIPGIGLSSAKFVASDITEAAGVLTFSLAGSMKPALRFIQDVAQEDPRSAAPTTAFGYDFYLGTQFTWVAPTFTTDTPAPDMYYFKRGAIPSGGASSSGLTIQFQVSEANPPLVLRSMLADYTFPKATKELANIARIEYSQAGTGTVVTELDSILYFDTLVGGPFQVGELITGGTSGTTATITYVGSGFLCFYSWSGNFTILETITGGTSLATARVTSVPRQTWEQDIEVVVRGYDILQQTEAHTKVASLLFRGSSEIERGEFGIVRFPYHVVSGQHDGGDASVDLIDNNTNFLQKGVFSGLVVHNTTDASCAGITSVTTTGTLNDTVIGVLAGGTDNDWDNDDAYQIYVPTRAGHVVRVINALAGVNQDMVVAKIQYDEGPGVAFARLEVLGTTKGIAAEKTTVEKIYERFEQTALSPYSTSASVTLPLVQTFTAGENLTDGDPVYLSAANTVMRATSATRSAQIGIANATVANGSSVGVVVYGPKATTSNAAIAAGDLVSASAVAGQVITVASALASGTPSATVTVGSNAHTHGNTAGPNDAGTSVGTTGATGVESAQQSVAYPLHGHAQADTGSSDGTVGLHTHTNPTTGVSDVNGNVAASNHTHTVSSTTVASSGHTHAVSTGPSATTTVATDTHTHTGSLGIILGKAVTAAAGAGNAVTIFVTLS